MRHPMPLLFVGLMTTGDEPARTKPLVAPKENQMRLPWHEIIELGAIMVKDVSSELVIRFDRRIVPEHLERGYPCFEDRLRAYEARRARGDWRDAVSRAQMVDQFLRWCKTEGRGPVVLAGHNAPYVSEFLSVAFRQCGISCEEEKKYIPLVEMFRCSKEELKGGFPLNPSEYRAYAKVKADWLGVELSINPPSAFEEARNVRDLYRAMLFCYLRAAHAAEN